MEKQPLFGDHRKLSKTELHKAKAEGSWRGAWSLLAGMGNNRMGMKFSTMNHLPHCPGCCCLSFKNTILSSIDWQCGAQGPAPATSHTAPRATRQRPGQGPARKAQPSNSKPSTVSHFGERNHLSSNFKLWELHVLLKMYCFGVTIMEENVHLLWLPFNTAPSPPD